MPIRFNEYFSGRIVLDSQAPNGVAVKSSFWDFIKRIIYLIFSPESYKAENRKAIACFEKYVTANSIKHNLNLTEMKKVGSPLFEADLKKYSIPLTKLDEKTKDVALQTIAPKKDSLSTPLLRPSLQAPPPQTQQPKPPVSAPPVLPASPPKPKPAKPLEQMAPVGLANDSCNCGFNAAIQFLLSDPQMIAAMKALPTKKDSSNVAELKTVLKSIVEDYEKGCVANSQPLRLALHKIAKHQFSPLSHKQQDAAIILTYILDHIVPEEKKMTFIEWKEFDTNGLPPIHDNPTGKTEKADIPYPILPIAIQSGKSLSQMLEGEYKCQEIIERKAKDGKDYDYPTTAFKNLKEFPAAFRIQMKRFEFLYSLGLAQKINAKVDIPEKIVVKVDGKEEEYQLSSFIHHQGTLKGGHYTAYRKVENTWFFMSDTTVKVADLAEMKEALETSYILCYQRDQGNNPSEEG